MLLECDLAQDVKTEYLEFIRECIDNDVIEKQLCLEYKSCLDDVDDAPVFWLSLANVQWDMGRLSESVKTIALREIELLLSKSDDDSVSKQICAIREKITSPQPKTKSFKKRTLYRCKWEIGDVFALPVAETLVCKNGQRATYFLLQKVDEGVWYPGHIVPIVRAKVITSELINIDETTIDQAEYVQEGYVKYEDRLRPIDYRMAEEQIAQRSKMRYEVDEYGFLPVFRFHILTTSDRNIPKILEFLGNYPTISPPPKEFVPHDKINIQASKWKDLSQDLIRKYAGNNLRGYKVYKSNQI